MNHIHSVLDVLYTYFKYMYCSNVSGLTVVYPDTGDSENILSMKNNFLEPATKRAYANYDEYIYTAQYSQGNHYLLYCMLS